MNKENLRKVIYQRNGDLHQFEAGFENEAEMNEGNELLIERIGSFHHSIKVYKIY
jgi:hypothetical protein